MPPEGSKIRICSTGYEGFLVRSSGERILVCNERIWVGDSEPFDDLIPSLIRRYGTAIKPVGSPGLTCKIFSGVASSSGDLEVIKVSPRKSDSVSFAVGSPQKIKSYIWRFWVQGDEVYLGARDMLGVFKVSLHKSGIWRIANVKELDREDESKDRVHMKWTRPVEFIPGWTSSVAVLVSPVEPKNSFLIREVDNPQVFWIPPAPKGKRLVVRVFFSAENFSESDLLSLLGDTRKVLAQIKKKGGEIVWLIVEEGELTDFEKSKIEHVMRNIVINVPSAVSPDDIESRVLLVVSEDTPTAYTQPTILDISLGKENLQITNDSSE